MGTAPIRLPTLAPGGLPFLGHALELKTRPGEFLLGLQSGEPVLRLKLGKTPAFVVNDPALVREVLLDPRTFARGGAVTERFRQMFGNGLGISDGPLHRRQRAVLAPAFSHVRVAEFAATMTAVAEEVTGRWREGETVRMEKEMDELALTVITRVVFSDGLDDRRRFMEATGIVLRGLFRHVTDTTGLLTRIPTRSNRRYAAAQSYVRTTIEDVVRSRRESPLERRDLLSLMIDAVDEDGRPAMDDTQLHDEVTTLFIAGSNTISNTLAWALYELSTHPDVEQRLHAEVDEVLFRRPAEFADVPHLDYTRRVIAETLRLRTQGLFLTKATTAPAELGGYAIPGGATILYSFHALNHNPLIHPDPERFDPDRWLPDRAEPIPKSAFMPFAAGLHGCIAEHFAWTEMVIALATVAARWRLTTVPGHVPRPVRAITMPVDALPMTPTRRDHAPRVHYEDRRQPVGAEAGDGR